MAGATRPIPGQRGCSTGRSGTPCPPTGACAAHFQITAFSCDTHTAPAALICGRCEGRSACMLFFHQPAPGTRTSPPQPFQGEQVIPALKNKLISKQPFYQDLATLQCKLQVTAVSEPGAAHRPRTLAAPCALQRSGSPWVPPNSSGLWCYQVLSSPRAPRPTGRLLGLRRT